MEQLVNEKVDMFWRGIEGGANKRGQVGQVVHPSPMTSSTLVQIDVTFSEKRPKKSWFQVYMGEEDVPWEQWCVSGS
jgi:autophagy-related protein 101